MPDPMTPIDAAPIDIVDASRVRLDKWL